MIRWVSPEIGTGAWDRVDPPPDAFVLDVRDMVDRSGNHPASARRKIEQGLAQLREGKRVVVCCDYGMSRSSSVAAGILAVKDGVAFDDAVRTVMNTTGEKAIRIEVLDVVRRAIESGPAAARPSGRRSVLLTGASGFLGRALTAALGESCDVAAPPRAELDLLSDTIKLEQMVRGRAVDTVVHLANPRIYTTNKAMGEALVMLKSVLDVCVQQRAHLVFLSGWEVFSGYRARELFADETLEPRPGTNYGHAKLLGERLLSQVAEQTGLPHTLVRASPVYGPGSPKPKFIWNFAEKAARGAPIVTHRYLNGDPGLDLLHVDDLVSALVAITEHRPATTLHVGTGVLTSTRRVAEMIVRAAGSSAPVSSNPIDGYTANVAMDTARARTLLGWRPRRKLAAGLAEMLAGGDPSRRADAGA